MNFCLRGQKIRQKTCTKYLGLLLDKYLLFKDQINFLKQKIGKMVFWLNGDITCLLIYYSLFDKHLCYTSQVWWQSNSDILVMIQRAQNKALRIIHLEA